jgi:hypothetical protein
MTRVLVRRNANGEIDWSAELIAELVRQYGTGASQKQIAIQLGISKDSIGKKVQRLGLEERGSPIHAAAQSDKPFVHPDRSAAGLAPLPPGHPLAMWRREEPDA